MDLEYSNYITEATQKMLDCISTGDISREEVGKYLSAFTDNLERNVFTPEKLEPYQIVFAKESVVFLDDVLDAASRSIVPVDEERFASVTRLAERQKSNLEFLESEGIESPIIKIHDIDHLLKTIHWQYDNNCLYNEALKNDQAIDVAIKSISTYSDSECNRVFELLDRMERIIDDCHSRNVDCTNLRYADTGRIRRQIIADRQKAENKAIWEQVLSLDERISKLLLAIGNGSQDPTKEVIPLLDEMDEKIKLCKTRGIETKILRNADTIAVRKRLASNSKRIEDEAFFAPIVALDERISTLLLPLGHGSKDPTDEVTPLLDEMNVRIKECEIRGIKTDSLKNADTNKIRERLAANTKRIDDEAFFVPIVELDNRISTLLLPLGKGVKDPTKQVTPLLNELDLKIRECKERGISVNSLVNADTDVVRKKLEINAKRIADDKIYAETQSIDKKISAVTNDLGNADSAALSSVMLLLDDLEARIKECRDRGIVTKYLLNEDTNKTRKRILDYQQDLAERNALYEQISDIDGNIVNACRLWNADHNQIENIISLCDHCAVLLDNCSRRNWNTPDLKCVDPFVVKNKYMLYQEIVIKDKKINSLISDASKGNNKLFSDLCQKQKANFSTCAKNHWAIPDIIVSNLDEAIKKRNKAVFKKNQKAKIAIIASAIAIVVVVFAISILIYFNTHSQLPILLNEAVGSDYQDIVNAFEDAGFKNVSLKPDSSGIQDSEIVTGITVDGSESFSPNTYYSHNADIVVYYSSDDRIDLEEVLDNLKSQNYEALTYQLESMGFDVDVNELDNDSTLKNAKISSIIVNGVDYTSGECFAPEGSNIIIDYYGIAYKVETSAEDLVWKNYQDVRAEFVGLGFNNIVFVKKDDLVSGFIIQDGSVESVTINGDTDFKAGDAYNHNAEIVITVHTIQGEKYLFIDN